MQQIKYSVIIPTYQHCNDLLKPCIESIIDYTDLSNVEVIIVANGCTDNTKEYCESLPEPFKLIWIEEPAGYTKSTNEGIKIAQGEYIILLNNDCVLLAQEKNAWIDQMLEPFISEPNTGITGAMMGHNFDINKRFLIFFCVMIKSTLFDELGLLDEWFSPGGGEDTDFCIKAELAGYGIYQVPRGGNVTWGDTMMYSDYPIYHPGEGTMHDKTLMPEWDRIFKENSDKLVQRYGSAQKKLELCNNYERAVIDKTDVVPPREHTRYQFAKNNIKGKKILELGCSSGYGIRYFKHIEGLEYLGLDYDPIIIEYATEQFGAPNIKFEQFNLETQKIEGYYDAIIAYEVIEHLTNGKELAQELKEHCDQLFLTTPYKEPVGFWGEHHKLHNLTQSDFPEFNYKFINETGYLLNSPDINIINLMIMEWDKNNPPIYNKNEFLKVTCAISTRNRYYTTLPLCLSAIANQTRVPDELIIFDDGDHLDMREMPLLQNIFRIFDVKKIDWRVIYGAKQGQVKNHQLTLEMAKHELIWRLDDDNVPGNNVLETLLHYMDDEVGAIAGLIIDPKNDSRPNINASNKINDIFKGLNEQWFYPANDYDAKEVDHLYSSFLFRKIAGKHGYNMNLSSKGFREETMFTYEIKRAGWKVLITPKCLTWHFEEQTGGVRDDANMQLFQHDEEIFKRELARWNMNVDRSKYIILNNGIGDHFAFKSILPEILKQKPDMILGACYPSVFYDYPDLKIISIAEAQATLGTLDDWDLYKFSNSNNWKSSLIDAYRKMYIHE